MIDNGRGFPARDMDPYLRRVEISFAPNGASAPTSSRGCVGIWSVVRVSTGLFRVTLRDGYREVNHFDARLQLNAAAALRAIPGPVVDSARTFDIFTVDGLGSVADISANANNRINVFLVLRCSELKA